LCWDGDGKVKAPPSAGCMWLECFEFLSLLRVILAIRFAQDINCINDPSAIRPYLPRCEQDRLARRGRTNASPSRLSRDAPPLRGLRP